jgi:hypothetical protein
LPTPTPAVWRKVVEGNILYHEIDISPVKSALRREPAGAPQPVQVSDQISTFGSLGSEAYFSTSSGLNRLDIKTGATSLTHSVKASRASAIGVSEQAIFWAEGRCLYKETK